MYLIPLGTDGFTLGTNFPIHLERILWETGLAYKQGSEWQYCEYLQHPLP